MILHRTYEDMFLNNELFIGLSKTKLFLDEPDVKEYKRINLDSSFFLFDYDKQIYKNIWGLQFNESKSDWGRYIAAGCFNSSGELISKLQKMDNIKKPLNITKGNTVYFDKNGLTFKFYD